MHHFAAPGCAIRSVKGRPQKRLVLPMRAYSFCAFITRQHMRSIFTASSPSFVCLIVAKAAGQQQKNQVPLSSSADQSGLLSSR